MKYGKNLASLKSDVFVIKNIDQVLEYVHGMFSEGGDRELETSEVLCAPLGLEIGSHLLLGFEASDVSFGLVVGERNRLNEGEGEPSVLVFEQALEQVAAFGVFGFSSFALFGRRFLAVGHLADVLELPHPGFVVVVQKHISALIREPYGTGWPTSAGNTP